MGNEKNLETKRLQDSDACIFQCTESYGYERITWLANLGEGNFKYNRIIDILYHYGIHNITTIIKIYLSDYVEL